VSRIIDHLDFTKFKRNPKWIIGFSDITILHSHVYRNYNIATLHAPMANAFNEEGYKNEFVQSLRHTLEGKKIKYQVQPNEFNKKGEAIGELVGGNLSLLAHLAGTDSDIKTKGRILFLEDVGEYLYNIDRMMYQLKRSGKLDKLAGLIIGGFTDMKDTEKPFGQTVYEIIRDAVAEYDYPVCFDFPVSHGEKNYALKVGVGYKLKVGKNKVVLEE
jgi:muramoyltetrapeptide carboxypeptidase